MLLPTRWWRPIVWDSFPWRFLELRREHRGLTQAAWQVLYRRVPQEGFLGWRLISGEVEAQEINFVDFGNQARCDGPSGFVIFDRICNLELQQPQNSSKRRHLRINRLVGTKQSHRRQQSGCAPEPIEGQRLDNLIQLGEYAAMLPQNAFQKQSGSVR